MILIVCVDDDKGMMFNHRRQSQDRVLRRHILDRVGDAKLWMNGYSAKMFEKDESEQVRKCLIVDEDFLKKAAKGEYCFAESDPCGKDMFPDTTCRSVFCYGSVRMETGGNSGISRFFS